MNVSVRVRGVRDERWKATRTTEPQCSSLHVFVYICLGNCVFFGTNFLLFCLLLLRLHRSHYIVSEIRTAAELHCVCMCRFAWIFLLRFCAAPFTMWQGHGRRMYIWAHFFYAFRYTTAEHALPVGCGETSLYGSKRLNFKVRNIYSKSKIKINTRISSVLMCSHTHTHTHCLRFSSKMFWMRWPPIIRDGGLLVPRICFAAD